jgi:hypothetical protein
MVSMPDQADAWIVQVREEQASKEGPATLQRLAWMIYKRIYGVAMVFW